MDGCRTTSTRASTSEKPTETYEHNSGTITCNTAVLALCATATIKMTEKDGPKASANRKLVLNVVHGPPRYYFSCPPP